MSIFFGLTAIFFLFILSAFWSGSETALTSLSKYRIKKIIALNKSLSAPLGQWLKSPYYLLTLILVGNTITNLTLSFLSTILAINIFSFLPRELVEFLIWLLVTMLLLVLGEVTPKIYSRHRAEKVTLFSLPILHRMLHIVSPIMWPFTKIINVFFPRLEIIPVGRFSYLSLEEIRALIEEANSSGVLEKDTGQMLERFVNLQETNVTSIMTPQDKIDSVTTINDEEKFLDLLVETGRSRVPIYNPQARKITGFVHTKDLLQVWRRDKGHFSTEIIRPAYFVKRDKKIYDILKEFQTGKTHMAFVQDELGNLLGIVTLEDVLEAIVGEILDEYDYKKTRK